MQVVLLNSGRDALANALATQGTVAVTKWRVGSTSNITLDPATTDVTNEVDNGTANQLYYSLISPNEVRFVLTLDESLGDYDVGNIMLLLDDDTPFLLGTTITDIPKTHVDLPTNIGNRLIFNFTLTYSNVSDLIDVNILAPTYATIPQTATQLSIPEAGTAPHPNYWIQNVTNSGRPTITGRRTQDQVWFGVEFMGHIESADFGYIQDGGLLTDTPFDSLIIFGGGYYNPYVNTDTEDFGSYTDTPGETIDFGTYV